MQEIKKQLTQSYHLIKLFPLIGKIEDESFCFFPAKAWIGDRLAIDTFRDLLTAILDVGFNHQALHKPSHIGTVPGTVEYLLGNAYLLDEFLAGVAVVCVHNDSGVHEVACGIEVEKLDKVLIMIVRMSDSVRVNIPPQDGMSERVAGTFHLPVAVDESMRRLCRLHGVHHHGKIASGRVFHPDRDVEAACRQPVLLVLDRTRSDCNI